MASKQSKPQKETVGRVMHEFKHGELRSGASGIGARDPLLHPQRDPRGRAHRPRRAAGHRGGPVPHRPIRASPRPPAAPGRAERQPFARALAGPAIARAAGMSGKAAARPTVREAVGGCTATAAEPAQRDDLLGCLPDYVQRQRAGRVQAIVWSFCRLGRTPWSPRPYRCPGCGTEAREELRAWRCGAGPGPLVSLRCPGRGGAGGSSRAMSTAVVAAGRRARDPAGVTGVITGAGSQCVTRWARIEGMISYRHDNGSWLNAAGDHAPAVAPPAVRPGRTLR